MSQSSMPDMSGALTDSLEFMKNLWGGVKLPGMAMPGMVMPTLSVEEIDKQIADLKAVESWLTVNMNMLHGTIKALEVQSATMSTLQAMSANFSAAMQPSKTAEPPAASTFSSVFSPAPAKAAAPPAPPPPEPVAEKAPVAAPSAPAPKPAAAVNPAAWWTMLQDQFKQAVATAITPEDMTPAKKPAASAAAKKPVTAKKKPTATAKRKPAATSKRKPA